MAFLIILALLFVTSRLLPGLVSLMFQTLIILLVVPFIIILGVILVIGAIIFPEKGHKND